MAEELIEAVRRYRRLFVLTGAGCSTESGIPAYRDRLGRWRQSAPVQFQDFIASAGARRRYWRRSMVGWPLMNQAEPGLTHRSLVRLEDAGYIDQLVTQNVDGLHRRAGSQRLIDLHGCLDTVSCLDCGRQYQRSVIQRELIALNPHISQETAAAGPDGDAVLEDADSASLTPPACAECGGILKPDVVFFGENVPRTRVRQAMQGLQASAALLVVGSSLTVYSGFRFCRAAQQSGIPIIIVNQGRTRADDLAALKLEIPCGEGLAQLAQALCD